MKHRTHLLVIVSLMAIGTAYNSGARFDAAAGVAGRPVVSGADDDSGAAIVAAVDAFEDVGMHLPELTIVVHDSYDGCNGHPGVFSKGGDKNRVDICFRDLGEINYELRELHKGFFKHSQVCWRLASKALR